MKTLIRFFSLMMLVAAAGIFHSCEKLNPDDPGKGILEITLNDLQDDGLLKSATTDTADSIATDTDSATGSLYILITISDENGTVVLDDEMIPVFNFGGNYVGQRIDLDAGKYSLTRFMVINANGKVIYASPLEGSPKSYIVDRPLPVGFSISAEKITRVVPEVLSVADESPEEFGYAAFGFQVRRIIPFYVMAVIVDDNAVTVTSANKYPTEALLTVFAQSGWQHRFKLEAGVNRVEIRGGSEFYTLVGEKDGYPPRKFRLTPRELLNSSKENPIIIHFSKTGVLKLKPGPREGKDAMISDLEPLKNFGDHTYFEATFLSEPVLTVMRTNRSLIQFDFDSNRLPAGAQIKRVILTLYNVDPIPHRYEGGDNPASSVAQWYGAVLQRIIEPWEEYKVTWDNQPKTTRVNQVYITPFTQDTRYVDIDVTRLYLTEDSVDRPHHGMLLRHYPSELFPGFRFASSDYSDRRMHPELKIYYTLP